MQRDARIPRSRWKAEVAQSKQLCLHGRAAEPVTPRHIKHNATLQSFSMDAWETQIGDATGVAMAEAIKHNATLKSFSMDARDTEIGDATGVAMAEAIKQNAHCSLSASKLLPLRLETRRVWPWLRPSSRTPRCSLSACVLGKPRLVTLCFSGQRTGLVALGFCCLSRPLSSRRLR